MKSLVPSKNQKNDRSTPSRSLSLSFPLPLTTYSHIFNILAENYQHAVILAKQRHTPLSLPLCSRPCDYRGIRGINKAARAFRGTARKKATAGRYTHTMWYSRERTGKAITLPLPRAPGLRLFLGRVPPERGTRERGRGRWCKHRAKKCRPLPI